MHNSVIIIVDNIMSPNLATVERIRDPTRYHVSSYKFVTWLINSTNVVINKLEGSQIQLSASSKLNEKCDE